MLKTSRASIDVLEHGGSRPSRLIPVTKPRGKEMLSVDESGGLEGNLKLKNEVG